MATSTGPTETPEIAHLESGMKISLESFALPFFLLRHQAETVFPEPGDDEDTDRDELRARLETLLPSSAICLGAEESTGDNFTTWSNEDHYYVMPWGADGFDWAVFAISWDDNWGRWEFRSIARRAGIEDWRDAATSALEAAFDHWGLLDDEEEAQRLREFLDSIGK